ncbi:MAG: M13 family metallopeptidase [Terriglobales bacterium]
MRILKSLCVILLSCPLLFSQSTKLHGVDLSDINRKVDPCTDFYEYANGTWRANNPIPPSMTRWSKRWQAGETSKDKLRAILEEAEQSKNAPKGSSTQLIGDFYAACTNQAGIDVRGLEPLKPWLAKIDGANDVASLQPVIFELHDIGVAAPFFVGSRQDPHNPTMVLADVAATGLSLPEKDYYVGKEARFVEAREKYKEYITSMFKLAGWDATQASAAAQTVLAMEIKMAEASLGTAELRDPKATDHKTTLAELQAMARHIDWDGYLAHNHLPKDVPINVDQPKYMQALDRQLVDTPLADWKIYLEWHLLDSAASALPTGFVNANFEFYGKYLGGASEIKPRWKQCVEATDQQLGEALGQKYVEKYFPPEAKARMQEMVKNLLAAMKDDIETRPWMSEETKQKALAKIATFNPKIGYPDKWKDYSKLDIRRDDYFNDMVVTNRFGVEDDHQQIGKPVDRGRWGLTPPTSDAYYNPQLNEIVFPAGILQPPAFYLDAVDAVNYGAIGVVIGHEISHGFDDQGAQFAADGSLTNWWTADDLKKFHERAACVADQFENYYIEKDIHHNGKLVLGESIGDLGGAKIAYLAFERSLRGKPRPPDIDGFTPEQQFFIAWGQFRGDAMRPEAMRLLVQSDPHPVAKYRVNGPLSNLPEFQQAFHCKADAAMVRPEGKRCEVW